MLLPTTMQEVATSQAFPSVVPRGLVRMLELLLRSSGQRDQETEAFTRAIHRHCSGRLSSFGCPKQVEVLKEGANIRSHDKFRGIRQENMFFLPS